MKTLIGQISDSKVPTILRREGNPCPAWESGRKRGSKEREEGRRKDIACMQMGLICGGRPLRAIPLKRRKSTVGKRKRITPQESQTFYTVTPSVVVGNSMLTNDGMVTHPTVYTASLQVLRSIARQVLHVYFPPIQPNGPKCSQTNVFRRETGNIANTI